MTSRFGTRLMLVVAGLAIGATAAGIAVSQSAGRPADQSARAATPKPPSSIVSVGKPVEPYPAGDPPQGLIEMRAANPEGGEAIAVLFHRSTRERRGETLRSVCAEHGPQSRIRDYPVEEGGSCTALQDGQLPTPLTFAIGSGINSPVAVHGFTSDDVERLTVSGPGGTLEVPRSRHGAYLVLYNKRAEGEGTLTAHLRDGTKRYWQFELPPSFRPPGSVRAPDPGGLPDWTAWANRRQGSGPRAGQTCTQFVQQLSFRDSRSIGGNSGPAICGDLDQAPVIADAIAYGPRPGRHTFGPMGDAPRRLIVWGAAAQGVKRVAILGPDGRRNLPLGAAHGAFIAVYPPTVAIEDVTLEVTLADGTTRRYPAPDRVNVASLNDPPIRAVEPLALRRARTDDSKLVLSATYNRYLERVEVTLAGREVRLRPIRPTDNGVRYAGVYDRDRGVRRSFTTGDAYYVTAILCANGCITHHHKLELQPPDGG